MAQPEIAMLAIAMWNAYQAREIQHLEDGEWHTLADIEAQTGDKIKSISAQIRNLRKPEGGAYKIIKRERAESVFEYRLVA